MPPPPPHGAFIPAPVYGNLGLAMVVYRGGTVADLELAAGNAGASGVRVQDGSGRFQLLPVRGPIFVQEGFAAAFPPEAAGAPNFARVIAVTLVKSPF